MGAASVQGRGRSMRSSVLIIAVLWSPWAIRGLGTDRCRPNAAPSTADAFRKLARVSPPPPPTIRRPPPGHGWPGPCLLPRGQLYDPVFRRPAGQTGMEVLLFVSHDFGATGSCTIASRRRRDSSHSGRIRTASTGSRRARIPIGTVVSAGRHVSAGIARDRGYGAAPAGCAGRGQPQRRDPSRVAGRRRPDRPGNAEDRVPAGDWASLTRAVQATGSGPGPAGTRSRAEPLGCPKRGVTLSASASKFRTKPATRKR